MTSWREEVIWAAGFFDGEGHTSARKNNKASDIMGLMVEIDNTNLFVLERFQNAMLGVGKIYGPYQTSGKPRYRYSTSSWKNGQAVICMLLTFLSPEKQEQCVNALEDADKPSRVWGR